VQVFRTLIDITKDIEGAKVENHKFCVSVHYRNVEEKVRINCLPPTIDFFFLISFHVLTFLELIAELDSDWSTCPWCLEKLPSFTFNSWKEGI